MKASICITLSLGLLTMAGCGPSEEEQKEKVHLLRSCYGLCAVHALAARLAETSRARGVPTPPHEEDYDTEYAEARTLWREVKDMSGVPAAVKRAFLELDEAVVIFRRHGTGGMDFISAMGAGELPCQKVIQAWCGDSSE